jgi:ABC-type Fe3+-citrate transport system substrate-binding protein
MDWLENFNKVLESKIRLGLMSVLVVNESLSFNELKELLTETWRHIFVHWKKPAMWRYANNSQDENHLLHTNRQMWAKRHSPTTFRFLRI